VDRVDTVALAVKGRRTDRARAIQGAVRPALRAVRSGEREPEMIRHPLGFMCLPLHRSDRLGLCIHVWRDDVDVARPTTSGYHLHTWNLFSYVLYGGVKNEVGRVWEPPRPRDAPFRLFEIHSREPSERGKPPVDHIVPTPALVAYTATGAEKVYMGDGYVVNARQYHRTQVMNKAFTATLVLAEDWDERPQLSLGAVDHPEEIVTRDWYPAEVARTVADHLLHVIPDDE